MKRFVSGQFATNIYLLEHNNEAFIIDPGLDCDKLISQFSQYKIIGVLLTHGHVDHIDCIDLFNCPIYIHEEEYEFLFNKQLSLYDLTSLKPKFNFKNLNIKKVKDNDIIIFNDNEIKVIHTPGHTRGSVCYLYKDKLFSGDTLFKGGCGRTDLYTANSQKMQESLQRLCRLPDFIKVYPGHDEQTTILNERKFNPELKRKNNSNK